MTEKGFGFGIETEFLLVSKDTYVPLSHKNLDFNFLAAMLNSIPTERFGERGFNIKPLHTKASPYLVEGYYLTDSDMKPLSLLPKGIEIRTPMSDTIEETIDDLKELFELLRQRCLQEGYDLAVVSHHPTESKLDEAPNYRRHDYWQWALTAATTYGPDINISVPESFSKNVDQSKLAAKLNYYMPSVIALTLSSPICEGDLWRVRGRIGKSIRTYRRSIWAPLFYVHEKPALRFEFKGFEMSRCLEDYNAFFLLSLALLLDDELNQQAPDEARLYDLGSVAVVGLESEYTREIAERVLESAEKVAQKLGLSRDGLDEFWNRLKTRHLPADDIVASFEKSHSIEAVMSGLLGLYSSKQSNGEGKISSVLLGPHQVPVQ